MPHRQPQINNRSIGYEEITRKSRQGKVEGGARKQEHQLRVTRRGLSGEIWSEKQKAAARWRHRLGKISEEGRDRRTAHCDYKRASEESRARRSAGNWSRGPRQGLWGVI